MAKHGLVLSEFSLISKVASGLSIVLVGRNALVRHGYSYLSLAMVEFQANLLKFRLSEIRATLRLNIIHKSHNYSPLYLMHVVLNDFGYPHKNH